MYAGLGDAAGRPQRTTALGLEHDLQLRSVPQPRRLAAKNQNAVGIRRQRHSRFKRREKQWNFYRGYRWLFAHRAAEPHGLDAAVRSHGARWLSGDRTPLD